MSQEIILRNIFNDQVVDRVLTFENYVLDSILDNPQSIYQSISFIASPPATYCGKRYLNKEIIELIHWVKLNRLNNQTLY
jgi:hypothetical protein